MVEYTKANERAITATGIGTAYPSPYDFSPNGVISAISLPLYPFANFRDNDGGPLAAYNWDADYWGAAITIDTGISGQLFPSLPVVPYDGNYVGIGTSLEGFMFPTNVTWTALAFAMDVNDTQQTNVAPSYLSSYTYAEIVATNAGGQSGGIPIFLNGTDPLSIITRTYPDLGPELYISGGFYNGVLTPHNIAKFDGSLQYYPLAAFGNAAPYKMLASDVFGYPYAEAEFSPEAFGGDNYSGTFTNTELETITFDDPVIQDMVDNGVFYDAAISDPLNEIFYSGFETGPDELTYIGFMPLTQTYDVLIVTGYQSELEQLFNHGYAQTWARYDSVAQTITLFGLGFVPSPGLVTVPTPTGVKLPCQLFCIPLFDKRRKK